MSYLFTLTGYWQNDLENYIKCSAQELMHKIDANRLLVEIKVNDLLVA